MSAYRKYAKLPGFRDFPPEELAFRNHIFDAWRGVAGRYGYQEYDGPPLEELELYTDKSGSEIVGQLYEFTDKGARRVALRPEMTPSLARILAGRSRALRKPIRWFSIPQLFRYERQQRGRLREHFQWNVDLVGESGTGADAEVLAVAIDGLRELGLGAADIRARVSDRILLSRVFAALDVPPDRTPGVFAALDRIERESVDRIRERLAGPGGSGLGRERADAVLGFFSDPTIGRIERDFAGSPRVAERAAELRRYESVLGDLGFADFVEFDFSIVRGLAYYTGIVFEIFDRAGRFRAICGGGRYDRLMEHVGGDRLSAVGFGMGDVVLGEVVRARGPPPGVPAGGGLLYHLDQPRRGGARPPDRRGPAEGGAERRLRARWKVGEKAVLVGGRAWCGFGHRTRARRGGEGGCGCEGDGERAGARDPDRRADRPGSGREPVGDTSCLLNTDSRGRGRRWSGPSGGSAPSST